MFRNWILSLGVAFCFVSAAATLDAHQARLATDDCHNSKEHDTHCHEADETIAFASNEAGYYEIAAVTDGDTLDLVYGVGTLKIRFFGVDTPETQTGTKLTNDAKAVLKANGITKDTPDYENLLATEKERQKGLGDAAKTYVEDTLEGKQVYVMFDNTDEFPFILQGKYGRYLAYVFYREDGITRFLNIDLVVENHAEIDYIDAPFRYRWAFVPKWGADLDLAEIQRRFGEVNLPDIPENIDAAPQRHNKIAIQWAQMKARRFAKGL